MTTTITIASLALAALAVFLSLKSKAGPPTRQPHYLSLAGLAVVLVLAAVIDAPQDGALGEVLAVAIGLSAAALAAWARANGVGGFAIGVASAVVCGFFPEARFACIAAIGLGALALSSEAAVYAALGTAATIACDSLGPKAGNSPSLGQTGSLLLTGLVLAGLVTLVIRPNKMAWIRPVLTAVLSVVVGILVVGSYLGLESYGLVIGAAALAALVIHWLIADSSDSLRLGLSAVTAVALGIVSFGVGQGLGLCLALAVSSAVLSALGNVSAILSLSPLLGLALYRVFRDAHPVAPPALEATQYNALIGLILGSILPLLTMEWQPKDNERSRSVGLWIWSILMPLASITAVIAAGPRGAVGMVIGLGLSGLLVVVRSNRSMIPLGTIVGCIGLLMASYGWLRPVLLYERDAKIQLLAVLAVVIAVLGAGLTAFTARQATEGSAP